MKSSQDILNTFADRLKELLEDRGWSVKAFADKIKIPRTTINGWTLKQKMPKIDTLYFIADFFGVTTDYLLGRED